MYSILLSTKVRLGHAGTVASQKVGAHRKTVASFIPADESVT
jgi:hypothetical protein